MCSPCPVGRSGLVFCVIVCGEQFCRWALLRWLQTRSCRSKDRVLGMIADRAVDMSPWAKTHSDGQHVHPLLFHLLDSALVALVLWDQYLAENQRRVIAEGLGLPQEQARAWVAFCGPRYPVLFWLPTVLRERHLHQVLSDIPPPKGVLVATATHDSNPAEQVWLPVTATTRHRLHLLPSDHGPDSAANPNWSGGHLDLTDQRPRPVHLR